MVTPQPRLSVPSSPSNAALPAVVGSWPWTRVHVPGVVQEFLQETPVLLLPITQMQAFNENNIVVTHVPGVGDGIVFGTIVLREGSLARLVELSQVWDKIGGIKRQGRSTPRRASRRSLSRPCHFLLMLFASRSCSRDKWYPSMPTTTAHSSLFGCCWLLLMASRTCLAM